MAYARHSQRGYPEARPYSEARPRTAGRRRRADASHWHWLLFVPIGLPLVTPLYNRADPALFGLPFYYWCQLAFAGVAAFFVLIIHVATKKGR